MKMSVRNRAIALAACCLVPAQMFADVSGTNPHPIDIFKIILSILGF